MIDVERPLAAPEEVKRPKIPRGWVLLGIALLGWIAVGLTAYIVFLSGLGWGEILIRLSHFWGFN